jgi:hypothetical protein
VNRREGVGIGPGKVGQEKVNTGIKANGCAKNFAVSASILRADGNKMARITLNDL